MGSTKPTAWSISSKCDVCDHGGNGLDGYSKLGVGVTGRFVTRGII